MVFEGNTPNQTEHAMWQGKKNFVAAPLFAPLFTIFSEVT